MGRDQGITEAQLLALDEAQTSEAFSPVERLVLQFAEGLTATPAHVSDELFQALRAHFDEVQLVELASTISWENHGARFNRAFDISAQGFSEGAFCPLPRRTPTDG